MKKIKESRLLSFLIIGIIYLFATIIQVLLFNNLSIENIYLKIFIIDIIATVFVYVFSLIFDNASIYDPYWSVEPMIILILLMLNNKLNHFILISFAAVFCFWGIRLTLNWAYTFKNLTKQDWRYTMLKEKTKKLYPLVNLFGIHMFPTLVVYLAMLPMIKLVEAYINGYSYIGIALMLLGVTIQFLSDYDVHLYHKKHVEDRRQIIQTGLWKYSRHPNYFGEILFWYGVFFAMLPIAFDCLYFVIGAVINNLMFVFISIPMSEKRLKSYKYNYEMYQKNTRMLIPFKK